MRSRIRTALKARRFSSGNEVQDLQNTDDFFHEQRADPFPSGRQSAWWGVMTEAYRGGNPF